MSYRNEIKEMKNIIEEIIVMYLKNFNYLELDELFEYLFFLDLYNLIRNYLSLI